VKPTTPDLPPYSPPPAALMPFRAASPGERIRLLDQGLVRPVIADVLVALDAPDSRVVRARATGLLIPRPARADLGWVVGFESAAWLHTGFAGTEQQPPARLQVIIPPGRRRPRDPLIRGRQIALPPDAVMVFDGVPVTTPVRTAADVARDLPAAEALATLRRLGELVRVSPQDVLATLLTMRYARGVVTARERVKIWAEER
jgi:hypothetical protein